MMTKHALAHAAEVALHGVLHVPQVVPPKAPVAAELPALPPVHPRRRLRCIIICTTKLTLCLPRVNSAYHAVSSCIIASLNLMNWIL